MVGYYGAHDLPMLKLNKYIVKQCSICQQNQHNTPAAPLHPWNWPDQPWVRLHLNFAGPFLGHTYLILVDTFSKHVEWKNDSS